jgi:hypothetical protein
VTGPTVQAALRLDAQASAFAGATVCVGVCYGPALGPYSVDGSQDLIKVNQNNNGVISVLGGTVSADQHVSVLDGLVNASAQIPNLDGSSAATPGGVVGGVLTSTKRDNIAAVNANVAQIAADTGGLPIPLTAISDRSATTCCKATRAWRSMSRNPCNSRPRPLANSCSPPPSPPS